MKMLRLIISLLLTVLSLCSVHAARQHFYTLNTQHGLSDNTILQLLQLQDGRLVIRTEKGVNIYDGQSFHFLPLDSAGAQNISKYRGATHLYVDYQGRLWLKNWFRVHCVDLQYFREDHHSLDHLIPGTSGKDIQDLYVDGKRDLWCVVGSKVINVRTKACLQLRPEWGVLQDIETDRGHVYTFHARGVVASFSEQTQRLEYTQTAYGKEDADIYNEAAMIIKSPNGQFYQKREGHWRSIILHFDPTTRRYEKMYVYDGILHTMMMFTANELVVSYGKGYLLFDLTRKAAEPDIIKDLFLPDGTSLTTGVNAILKDMQGGLWLGTYNKGLLYTSPLLGLFNMKPVDIPVTPILTNIYVEGQPLVQGKEYRGRVLQAKATPYVDSLALGRNDVAFQFCTMNYVYPRGTLYRYRLNGKPWQTVSADSEDRMVDNRGVLYLSFLDLQPGSYQLDVMATVNPKQWKGRVRTIYFTIAGPWWTAWWFYALLVLTIVPVSVVLLSLRKRKTMDMEAVPAAFSAPTDADASAAPSETSESPAISEQEREFIDRATTFVEQHLADADYGVEQLAQDLCMERTGLYKKLTALVDTTPVTFIRSIRLRKAADLIRQGEKGINEISAITGFTSPSYFAKCFKKEFGVKPSEYR